ncbi:hypothetical protein VP01_5199g1 [Puccinia sorghi]|uniref:Uncharacterized protein n=1 Tax=Puccinia sorghi TaxID=27349 RepID=A0A0L6UKR5_9BASI|nr:hypothetical protein VP01_5199g1 [Puccinia sorghi]
MNMYSLYTCRRKERERETINSSLDRNPGKTKGQKRRNASAEKERMVRWIAGRHKMCDEGTCPRPLSRIGSQNLGSGLGTMWRLFIGQENPCLLLPQTTLPKHRSQAYVETFPCKYKASALKLKLLKVAADHWLRNQDSLGSPHVEKNWLSTLFLLQIPGKPVSLFFLIFLGMLILHALLYAEQIERVLGEVEALRLEQSEGATDCKSTSKLNVKDKSKDRSHLSTSSVRFSSIVCSYASITRSNSSSSDPTPCLASFSIDCLGFGCMDTIDEMLKSGELEVEDAFLFPSNTVLNISRKPVFVLDGGGPTLKRQRSYILFSLHLNL